MGKFHLNQVITSHLIEYQNEKLGDKEVLIFEENLERDESVSFKDLHLMGNRLAAYFLEKGIKKWDTVGVFTYNRLETILTFIAASTIGAIAVPIDPRSSGERLLYFIKDAELKGLIVAKETEKSFDEVKDKASLSFVLKAGMDEKGENSVREIVKDDGWKTVEQQIFDVNHPAQIIYTSGTTGLPKGVLIKHQRIGLYNLLRQLAWKYKSDDILYTGLSLSHANAQAVTLFPALYGGLKAVFSLRFTKSKIWDVCRKYGCTTFSLLGGMAAGIFNEPHKETDKDNPVRVVVSAGMPKIIWREFEDRFDLKVHEWYGSVEGGFAHNPPGAGPVGSFGKPLPGIMKFKVVDEGGNEVGANVSGELLIKNLRGETKVEYWKKPEESAKKVKNGWLYTSDVVHFDENGWFYFDFRKGTELRKAGDFIQPEHVESVMGKHKDISEVSVFGIPAESGAPGESDIVAAVVLFDNYDENVIRDIFEYCEKNLEKNSVPSYIWVVEEIPKTPSEKHLKRVLKDKFSKDLDSVFEKD